MDKSSCLPEVCSPFEVRIPRNKPKAIQFLPHSKHIPPLTQDIRIVLYMLTMGSQEALQYTVEKGGGGYSSDC